VSGSAQPDQGVTRLSSSATRYNVGWAADLPDGERRLIEIGGRSIGVFNVGGRFFALRNRCPHQGGPLCRGRLFERLESNRPGEYTYDDSRHLLECPWHGWEFDLETGRSWFDPARTRVRRYSVALERSQTIAAPKPGELLPGPYTAESFPVDVQDECIVVDLGR
jgi:3-phenylpropionate/trans-cinnamate dioxygenase ferredoxin subunit